MDFKSPVDLRIQKSPMDSGLPSPNGPDRSNTLRGGSFSLEAPGSPQAMTPTHDNRRKLSIIGKTSPFSTCIPAIELSSTQSFEVADLDPLINHSQQGHHSRLVRTSSHQSPRTNRKDFGGCEAEYPGGRRRSRHHLSINMTDFVSRPQSFDGTTISAIAGPSLVPNPSLNSRFGCSMLLLPQGNPLGRRKSFIHQVGKDKPDLKTGSRILHSPEKNIPGPTVHDVVVFISMLVNTENKIRG